VTDKERLTMLKQPSLTPVQPEGTFHLDEDYIYTWEHEGRTFRLIVPQGFLTDVASVPRLVWTISGITPDGLHRAAAVVHDFLYLHQGAVPPQYYQVRQQGEWVNIDYTFTRAECDKIFARLMREAEVGKVRRRLMYLSVRVFGGPYWSRVFKP
jgi:hypothetical protein